MDIAVAERAEVEGSAFAPRSGGLRRLIIQQLRVGHGQRREAAHQYAAANPAVPRGSSIRHIVLDGAVGDGYGAGASGIGKGESAAIAIGSGIIGDDAASDGQVPGSVKASAPIEGSAELISGGGGRRIFSKTQRQVGNAGIESGTQTLGVD